MPRPILKKILWSILAVIGAFALLVGWTVSQLPHMSKVPRIEPAPGVVGVETAGSYVWMIRTAHGVALIDGGMDAQGKAILQELDREHLNSANVNTIFVTHGHRDHIGALAAFPVAKIWVGPPCASAPALVLFEDVTTTFLRAAATPSPVPTAPANPRS
jgi:glyoxylase-like metal-dependent hydrolase (beta-lactamase superfamily II)